MRQISKKKNFLFHLKMQAQTIMFLLEEFCMQCLIYLFEVEREFQFNIYLALLNSSVRQRWLWKSSTQSFLTSPFNSKLPRASTQKRKRLSVRQPSAVSMPEPPAPRPKRRLLWAECPKQLRWGEQGWRLVAKHFSSQPLKHILKVHQRVVFLLL